MLFQICPKLPMRSLVETKNFYVKKLGFNVLGDFGNYLLVKKDDIEIHFFEYVGLDTQTNYGQVYIRVKNIEAFYNELLENSIVIHPNSALKIQPWGQKEFSLLDPNNNLLTFGEAV